MDIQHGQGENLEVVFSAPNEYTAEMILSYLISENIPAIIESHMVPWMDGVMTAAEGHWGDIVAPREYAERSRELIAAYLTAVPENYDVDQDTEI